MKVEIERGMYPFMPLVPHSVATRGEFATTATAGFDRSPGVSYPVAVLISVHVLLSNTNLDDGITAKQLWECQTDI